MFNYLLTWKLKGFVSSNDSYRQPLLWKNKHYVQVCLWGHVLYTCEFLFLFCTWYFLDYSTYTQFRHVDCNVTRLMPLRPWWVWERIGFTIHTGLNVAQHSIQTWVTPGDLIRVCPSYLWQNWQAALILLNSWKRVKDTVLQTILCFSFQQDIA